MEIDLSHARFGDGVPHDTLPGSIHVVALAAITKYIASAIPFPEMVTPVMRCTLGPYNAGEAAVSTIKAGDRATLWMISTNRGLDAFDRAHALDVGGNPIHNPSLGGGLRVCGGSRVARVEMAVTFDKLDFGAPPERVQSNFIDGMEHLPLAA